MKSRRNRWAGYNNNPKALARRAAGVREALAAAPAPIYPDAAPLHGDWLGGCINGQLVVMRLLRHPSHRSDQWAAEIDGEVVADAAGLTALWAALHTRWHRAPSRRMLANLAALPR